MNQDNSTIELREEALNVLMGIKTGWSCGFDAIDNCVGRINLGNIWLIGAFSNSGKSFFTLNMVNRILENERDIRIGIFSTEMKKKAYIKRLVCLRAGFYWMDFENNKEQLYDKFNEELDEYEKERLYAPESLRIYSDNMSMEVIEQIVRNNTFDIIFIDYIQELPVGNIGNDKDKMPVLAKRIKQLATERNVTIIVISQLNNSAFKEDITNTFISPYSYGKEIYQSADVALLLERELVEGKLTNALKLGIVKARDGFRGRFEYYISNGFKIQNEISTGPRKT